MKRDELKALLRPSSTATISVIDWLKEGGVQETDIQDDGQWIKFVATICQAEALLDTKFSLFQHTNRKTLSKIRTLKYSLPKELMQYIDMVQPTTRFAQIRPERSQIIDEVILDSAGTELNDTRCNNTVNPTCLRELYKITGFTPDAKAGGRIGISGFLEQYAQYGDLAKWIPDYAPWAAGANFSWTSING
jgi:tripeptidyl-peptidase-1